MCRKKSTYKSATDFSIRDLCLTVTQEKIYGRGAFVWVCNFEGEDFVSCA